MADQKVALISGASRGLGLETGKQLLAAGWGAAFGMRAPQPAPVKSSEAVTVRLDVDDADSCRRAVAETVSRFGRLDALVNNAGIDYDVDQRALEPDFARVERILRTNLLGAWRLAVAAAPELMKTKGVIVNVSSGAGAMTRMSGGTPAYSVSKAALNALTVKLAAELKPHGVRVNAVCPGWVNTEMGKGGRPVPDGAKGIVWAAMLPANGPTGCFFRDGRPIDW
jgi:NAD(P)-dependent dehydrogenase (short-subunit alcohol dehydrogenase family)